MAIVYSDINTYAADISLGTLWNITNMIRGGAVTNSLMNASFNISYERFNAHARSMGTQSDVDRPQAKTGGKLAHVFEYGEGDQPGKRLYDLFMIGNNKNRTVTYKFKQSKTKVPVPSAMKGFYRRDHIFREKAAMMEEADPVNIDPVNSEYMVFWRPGYNSDVKDTDSDNSSSDIVWKKDTSHIYRAGGGQYLGNFAQSFIYWWTSELGGQGDFRKVAEQMSSTTAFAAARNINVESRISGQKKIIDNPNSSPRAIAAARKTINTINSRMLSLGAGDINNAQL